MARKITCTESDDKTCPKGYQWSRAYRLRTGSPIGLTPEYMVRWDRGFAQTVGTTACDTLTQARHEAGALVTEGRAWAEVFRWAENGTGIRPVFICSYEVETESGAAVA